MAVLSSGKNSGGLVAAAYLLPHVSYYMNIFYMNIVEFVHVTIIMPLPTQIDST
jgi:hypothetical protein